MQTGGPELAQRLEDQGWPEEIYADENGTFFYKVVPSLDVAMFMSG
ncbi:hypothetical protein SAMN04489717_0080 [Actinopolymorpha singaporensis]|uniref:Uncharacterized protein n=1 Tax=Actinopolymorpha singaporensis TaxID=117157 RepID=A0A1H1L310_9ACTN|nr:hypothetical protein SAMN04489717_0080 [Actinopolymorpha singaporensis]